MWPFDDIGSALGDGFKTMVGSAFEAAMTAIWQASLAVLRTAFGLADQFSVFSVSTTEGPLKVPTTAEVPAVVGPGGPHPDGGGAGAAGEAAVII